MNVKGAAFFQKPRAGLPQRCVLNRAARFLILFGLVLCTGVAFAASPFRPDYPFAQTSTNALTGDLLQFTDGSLLHGTLRGMNPERGLQWESPEAKQPIEFKPTHIDSIRFDNSRAIANQAKSSCKFRFADGDEFFGNLTSLDKETVGLETWFGKDLKVPRTAIESVTFLSRSFKVLYEGPAGPDGWTFGAGGQSWRYRDGALVTSSVGTVGRDFKLPSSSSFEFDLAWIGDSRLTGVDFRMTVALYTDVLDRFDYGSSCYLLHLTSGAFSLMRVHSEMGPNNLINSTQIPNARKKNSYHLEIRANKEESMIAILIDGVLVGKVKDDAGFSGKGTGVLFSSQNEGPTLKISNLRLSEWDGKFEDDRPFDSKPKEDHLRLINRDRATGKIGALRDGKLTINIDNSSAPLQIPLQRVSQIFFAGADAQEPPRSPWQVRALFAGGERISFQLEKWDDQQVSGTSKTLGNVTFTPASIRQIQFNLDQAKATADASSTQDEWDADKKSGALALGERDDAVSFQSGDLLYGSLQSFDPKSALIWQRPDLTQPVEFKTSGLAEVRLRRQPTSDFPRDCRVDLSNGDQLEGKLVAMDADKIALDTAYAGKLYLPRKRIVMLVPIQTSSAVVFEGPTGMEGWVHGKVNAVQDAGEWQYKNGALYATKAASIARDFKLPESSSIQFDVAWKGTFGAAVALYTTRLEPLNLQMKDTEPDFGGFYSLQLGPASTTLMMVKKDVQLKYLWRDIPAPPLTQKNNAHIEIRVSKSKALVALLVDGVLIKGGQDPDGFAGTGTILRFVHHGFGSLKLSNLRITEWDGQFDERSSNERGAADLTKLRNRDKVTGNVEAYRDGKFTIASENSKLQVPMERVKQIETPGKKIEVPKEEPSEITAYFRNGAPINFKIEHWDEKGIVASSSNFGKAIFTPSAFGRIVFKVRAQSSPVQ